MSDLKTELINLLNDFAYDVEHKDFGEDTLDDELKAILNKLSGEKQLDYAKFGTQTRMIVANGRRIFRTIKNEILTNTNGKTFFIIILIYFQKIMKKH